MNNVEGNLEFIKMYRGYLSNNLDKTDTQLVRLTVYLGVIITGYFLVLFHQTGSIELGFIKIEKKELVVLLTPAIYGYILLKTYVLSMYQQHIKAELKKYILQEFPSIGDQEMDNIVPFNFFHEMFVQLKTLGSKIIFAIFTFPFILFIMLFLLLFQLYILNNFLKLDFSPHFIFSFLKLASVTLTLLIFWFIFKVFYHSIKEEIGKAETKMKRK